MKRIMIIGSGGSGKSTLSKQLGRVLSIPVHHLDAYFWKPGWQAVSREEISAIQQQIFEKDTWIIDGNYSATMDKRIEAADTVIFLNYSTARCLYGIVKRRIQFHSKTRPDMGQDCPEKLDLEFFMWVASYQKNKVPIVREKLKVANKIQLLEFKNPRQTKNFLKNLS
ncbi:DNA topology modulation protein [Aquibacillus rhizosphaerae]|uniref:DNA topology modulation protein n=1 Tax=Aquibacillus rhizosphaerae TaxID=3051431 RepID=A0ABT7L3F1_9BACI|nr:DNA topology modulation protein [Aquibacillus sp. LR5S19]MDL4840391.1 DNA topology modulation protein [Aquibacillus sp. LR5S19]